MSATRVLILGAAGRDFHDFNTVFRGDPTHRVVAFTATQIPGIAGRRYPAELAGPGYPEGIPILDEAELEALVARHAIDEVVLSYSDLAHEKVMHLASRALASGAGFRLLAPRRTMLESKRPTIAVTAVRTGCGKSQVARAVARALRAGGRRVAVIRHPMPYGDLLAERVQRFATLADLDREKVTIEEREEYEPHIRAGGVVFAGVDYARILERAEAESDVIVWDGGNNDLPFVRPTLWITVLDPHRAGHELGYHPGEANLRSADVFVINKADSASPDAVERLERTARAIRPNADVVVARSRLEVDRPELIAGKRVLVIEDGPTVTHGEMRFGAGRVAAERLGAKLIVDPRPSAVGTIRATFERYPHLTDVLPAVGYSGQEVQDLEATIRRVECDAVVVGTPIDLAHLVKLDRPLARVSYELEDEGALAAIVSRFLGRS